MDLEKLQDHLNEIAKQQNNRNLPEFEGYSPFEMPHILHFTFGEDSPLKLEKLSDNDYKKIPGTNNT